MPLPTRSRPLARLLLVILTTFWVTPLTAKDLSQNEALQLRERGEIIALDRLLNTIEAQYPAARLLELELEEDDGLYVYEVEIMTAQSQVRDLTINAATGAIIEDELDD